jgi:PAS domain S-box-containing protein
MQGKTTHILLVEDEEAHAELIRRAFESQAGRVGLTVVQSLREAHTHLAASLPDLVIADLRLPDGNGLELVPDGEANSPYPVVVMTSHGDEHVAVEALKAGALDYVVKSEATLAEMTHTVDRALRQWAHLIERKQAEEALRASEERFRAIFDQTYQFVGLLRPDGTLLEANQTALDFARVTHEDVVGRPLWDTPWWAHAPELQQRLRAAVFQAAQGEFVRFEAQHLSADGTPAFFDFSLKPVKDEHGNVVLLIPEGRDITERKRAEEERAGLESQLRQSQKLETIGTLAGGIAHDFNNILQAILGYAELILQDVSPDSRTGAHLAQVVLAARRAKDLVQQILTFSRQVEQERQPVQIHLIVTEALTLLRASLPTTIAIRHHIDPMCETVLADPTRIHQLLMNLCTNAYQAMRDSNGVLEVRLDTVDVGAALVRDHTHLHEGPYVCLTVSDTGHGMDRETLARVFEPFFTTKDVGEGTGLGLSVVHGIVVSHDGAITVDSEPGKGTTFQVYFPRADRDIAQEVPKDEPTGTVEGRTGQS